MTHVAHLKPLEAVQLRVCDRFSQYVGQWLTVILLLITNFGCISIQWRDGDGNLRSAGFIHRSLIHTGRAKVIVHRTAGLNLRLTAFDGGLTLGYRKQISVQPCNAAGCTPGTQSAMLWILDTLPETEGLFARQTFGAEFGVDELQNGVRFGFNQQSIIFGPKSHETVVVRIDFSESDLSKTIYLEERIP